MTEYIDRTGEPDDVFEREVLARVEDPMTPVPSSPVALLDQLDAAREAAYDEVVRLCRGGDNRWTMSIPARPDTDSDLLIAKALDDHKRLTDKLRAVLEVAEELDGGPGCNGDSGENCCWAAADRIRAAVVERS